MAIIVKNVKITPSVDKTVVNRSYEVSIDEFGKVDNGLDLGCQGDHKITKIEFDVSALKRASTLANYNPVLVFSRKNANGTIENISCTGVNNVEYDKQTSTFYIPEDVTKVADDYSIVYTLREKIESSGNVGEINDTNIEGDIDEKEVFVSDIFTGTVRPSIYADLVAGIKVKNESGEQVDFTTNLLPKLVGKRPKPIKTTEGIYKKKIELTWPSGEGEKITINGDNSSENKPSLGNKYDVFMTYITIDHPFYHEQSTNNKDNEIFVIFVSNDKDKVNYAVITTAAISERLAAVWIPAEVTVSDRENWKVGFVGLQEDNSTNGYSNASYSPATDFILNQNFLTRTTEDDDIDVEQSAEVALMSFDGELQTAEEDGTVYTTTVYDARNTTYSLGMSGDDVKARLIKVNDLDAAMTTLKGDSATSGSIQNSISTLINAHNESSDAHEKLVRMGTGAAGYENYNNKNTVEGIVDVIRSEINDKVTSIGAMSSDDIREAINNAISSHNGSAEEVHQPIVNQINNTKTELTTKIEEVKDLINHEETGLDARVEKLEGDFNAFDTIYVNESELTEALNTRVLGFDPADIEDGEAYGSYTIKKLKDESDIRLSQTNVSIASVNVKAEEARATANQANQTAANAYEAVTTTIQNKADKAEVQSLNTKLDTEIAKNTKEHEAINKKINDDLAAAKIEIDGKITQAVSDAEYNLGLVDDQLKGQINDVKESIKNIGSNENTINTRLSAAETEISALNIKINGLDNTYATDAALESVKSDLTALETKESQDITNLENTINALKGSDVAEDVTISSIDSKVNTLTSDLETYKGEVNSSIANINTSIGELTSADEQINTSLNSKLSKTAQIQALGNVFNSEAEWEAFKESAEETTLYFVLEEE